MDVLLALAVFSLLSAGSGAPAARLQAAEPGACADVRSSSLELSHHARTASLMARNGSTDLASFSIAPAWMEAKDMCDPDSLKQTSKHCVRKLFSVLTSYNSAVERISGFESCSEFSSMVKPALKKLHGDVSKCLSLEEPQESKRAPKPIEQSLEVYLCRYTLDRLFSFSILTARVFAAGDPTHHAAASAHRCQ